jgi:cyclase
MAMDMQRVGKRGILVSYDDPFYTNVYIILGDESVFVLDTFLGKDSMSIVQSQIASEGCTDLPVVIFNSHADYDHFWGNGAFKHATIVGHELCRERILNEGVSSLAEHASHKKGEVRLLPPDQTFHDKLEFQNERIQFIHTPGHTLDSSSCYDEVDKVLFVGDNVESPIPYLNHANFEQYIRTLERYLEFNWNLVISGHDPPLKTPDLIRRNIDYLDHFLDWSFDLKQFTKAELHRHVQHNLNAIKDELMKGEKRSGLLRHLEEIKKLND